jgi:hypothetical protein
MCHGNGYGAISLETEEDIRKWREERRKNYPTKAKVEEKKAKMQEQKLKGQTIKSKKFDIKEKRKLLNKNLLKCFNRKFQKCKKNGNT